MKAVHEEVYKETVANLNLIRLNYEENKFQVYSESHWFLNALRIMANPYLTINVTVYNCVFSKKCKDFKKKLNEQKMSIIFKSSPDGKGKSYEYCECFLQL